MVIEKYGLSPDPGHDFGVSSFGHVRGKYTVEVVKNGTVFLVAVIEMLLVAVGKFSAIAIAVLKNPDDAEAGIKPALLRRGKVTLGSSDVLGR